MDGKFQLYYRLINDKNLKYKVIIFWSFLFPNINTVQISQHTETGFIHEV